MIQWYRPSPSYFNYFRGISSTGSVLFLLRVPRFPPKDNSSGAGIEYYYIIVDSTQYLTQNLSMTFEEYPYSSYFNEEAINTTTLTQPLYSIFEPFIYRPSLGKYGLYWIKVQGYNEEIFFPRVYPNLDIIHEGNKHTWLNTTKKNTVPKEYTIDSFTGWKNNSQYTSLITNLYGIYVHSEGTESDIEIGTPAYAISQDTYFSSILEWGSNFTAYVGKYKDTTFNEAPCYLLFLKETNYELSIADIWPLWKENENTWVISSSIGKRFSELNWFGSTSLVGNFCYVSTSSTFNGASYELVIDEENPPENLAEIQSYGDIVIETTYDAYGPCYSYISDPLARNETSSGSLLPFKSIMYRGIRGGGLI
ncbi:MAG: hypothetical protein U9Q38_02645 [Thermodesulfobacteriota bacterium]|nr:hypothetical protein [Thermodesulfobacteriota bacterium]